MKFRGTQKVVVMELPDCDICADGTKAKYDAKTRGGPWANLCAPCWQRHSYRTLGTGMGQELVVEQLTEADEGPEFDECRECGKLVFELNTTCPSCKASEAKY